eukprot:322839_1
MATHDSPPYRIPQSPERSPPPPPSQCVHTRLVTETITIPWDINNHYAIATVDNIPAASNCDQMIGNEYAGLTDVWMPSHFREINFNIKERWIADRFVFECNTNQIQCHGRFVRAYYWIRRKKRKCKFIVSVLNINCHISR